MKKKQLLAAAIAAMTLATSSVVFAAPVELDGEVSVHYRWNDNDGRDTDGGKTTLILNAKTALNEQMDVYARFAAQTLAGDKDDSGYDYDLGRYGSSHATLDQYGIILKGKYFDYKIGRQGVSISPTALLYSSEGYIGKNQGFIDGVVATGKSGITELQIVSGEAKYKGEADTKINSIHGSFNAIENLALGATLAKEKTAGEKTKYYGLDATYRLSEKASLVADYIESNADQDNKAFIFGINYVADAKNSFSIYNHRVEDSSTSLTDWDDNEKGMYYSYDYQINDVTALNVFYKDNKEIIGLGENQSFRTTVNYKF